MISIFIPTMKYDEMNGTKISKKQPNDFEGRRRGPRKCVKVLGGGGETYCYVQLLCLGYIIVGLQ
jgi:hypothetical protein